MRSGILCPYTYFRAFFFFSLVYLLSLPAMAQHTHNTLNTENVTAFIEETTKLTGGNLGDRNMDQAIDYLDRHLHEDSRFRSEMVYVIPGHPDQESALSLDKDEFMDSLKDGAEALDSFESDIEIVDIKLSSDKRKATVFTITTESGVMSVGGEQVPVDGYSDCRQILMLNSNDVLQMFNAKCETEIRFRQ